MLPINRIQIIKFEIIYGSQNTKDIYYIIDSQKSKNISFKSVLPVIDNQYLQQFIWIL